LNILVLTNLYPPHHLGGYELICLHVVTALRARGHTVHVLTSDHTVDDSVAARSESDIDRSLAIHGFYGHPWLPIRRLYSLESHNNAVLRQTIARLRPQLVYVWNMGGLSKSMLLTLQRLQIPTAFYLSDHWISRGLSSDVWLRWWNRPDAPPLHRACRALCQSAGLRRRWNESAPTNPPHHIEFPAIYFCSEALKNSTTAAGFPVAHGSVIHCPVNIEQFNGEPKSPASPIRKLLYVGRLAPDKGVMTALHAMAFVRGKFDGHLHLYGRGDADYVRQLQKFISTAQIPVIFDSASPDRMPQVYRDHDALIFPSEWEEPFAQTPLEAMSSGIPVIGTTTGGSSELFRHGENALTFRAGNADELASRMVQLASDTPLRVRIATAGYCEVRQRFAEPIIVGKIERFLQQTIAHWKPAPAREYVQ
jgi:glycogen synthase